MAFPSFRGRHPAGGEKQRSAAADSLAGEQRSPAADPLAEAVLVDEVEAFLQGRLVEHLRERHRAVPAWAVLNTVAHATREEIARLADHHPPEGRPADGHRADGDTAHGHSAGGHAADGGTRHVHPAGAHPAGGPATAGDARRDTDGPLWLRGQRALASSLLARAATPDEVERLQRALLVPLELWSIRRSQARVVTSREVLDAACELLEERPDPS